MTVDNWDDPEEIVPISLPPIGGTLSLRINIKQLKFYMVDPKITNFILELLNHPPVAREMIHVVDNLFFYLGGFWRRTSSGAYIQFVGA